MKYLAQIGLGVLLAGLGLVAGHMLATAPAADTGHVHGPACEHGDALAAAGQGSATPPSPQALKSMGVQVGPAVRSTFVLTRKVQATIIGRPLNQRPVAAPLGGVVTDIAVRTGRVVSEGDVLVTIARDPIARPKPELTAELLTPISENVHDMAGKLRLALREIEVTEQELARIEPFVESRTVPAKEAIDLRYQLARSQQEAENARTELETHGMTHEEIEAVGGGAHPPATTKLWQQALAENGLWTDVSQRVWLATPEAQRPLPWCVAAIGELTAAGLVSNDLARLLEEVEGAAGRFTEIAGLLLQGAPLDTIALLHRQGALEPTVRIRAPRHTAPDWDVEEILVRPGQRVEPGETVVRLYDARQMWLRLQPVGREMGSVAEAISAGEPLRATPLVHGSGPALDDVRLQRLALQGDDAGRGGLAHALVDNVTLACAPGLQCRSWQLRVGLRYLVDIPVERWEKRFVLPADAVTRAGPERVVFLQDGTTFRAQPVHVEYEDDEVVVLADDGSIFDDDPVVQRGAFALGLAIQVDASASNVADHGHAHN